jgi:hypothetical protein
MLNVEYGKKRRFKFVKYSKEIWKQGDSDVDIKVGGDDVEEKREEHEERKNNRQKRRN